MSVSPSENTPKVSRRDAQNALNDAEKLYKRAKKKLSAESITEIEAGLNALRTALAKDDDSVEAPYRKVQEIVEKTAQICSQIGGKRSRRKLAHRLGRRLRTAHVFRRAVQNPYAIDGSNAFGRRSIVRHQIKLWIAFALAQSLCRMVFEARTRRCRRLCVSAQRSTRLFGSHQFTLPLERISHERQRLH